MGFRVVIIKGECEIRRGSSEVRPPAGGRGRLGARVPEGIERPKGTTRAGFGVDFLGWYCVDWYAIECMTYMRYLNLRRVV